MRQFLNKSLINRLNLTLCAYTVLFWLLSELGALYFYYRDIDDSILTHIAQQLSLQARTENQRYSNATFDARALLAHWEHAHAQTGQAPLNSKQSTLIPLGDGQLNAQTTQDTVYAIDTFGAHSVIQYQNKFIYLPGQGAAFSPSALQAGPTADERIQELKALEQAPIQDKIRWGQPTYTPVGGWHISLGAVHPKNGAMAGFSVSLNDLSTMGTTHVQPTPFIWLDSSRTVFPVTNNSPYSSETIHTLLTQLPSCAQAVTAKLGAYRAICQPLSSAPWKIVLLYSRDSVIHIALQTWYTRLPFTLAGLIAFIATLHFVLRKQIARPLKELVELIDTVNAADLNDRLPEKRTDELGRIARAYNSLLTTVASHYATLERKVQERTQALDEAKRYAEQASQRKTDHITNISHEIRTPLNGIVGALSMLQQNPLTQDQQDLVYTALQSSSYLLGIINNLLDFSRIETGQMELSIEKTELLPLLDQALLTVNIKAKEKKLELYSLVMADVPHQVMLDELRFRQILVNLLGNAIKFTERGHVKLTVKVLDQRLAFSVEDTGKGIAPEHQRQIFLPFSQVRAHENGSGLGLTIAARLADLMGGEIQLESHLNWGSRFTLCLPLDPALAISAHTPFEGIPITAPLPLHPQLKVWGFLPENGANPALASPELWYLPCRLWNRLNAIVNPTTANEETRTLAVSPWSLKILVVDDVATNREIVGKMLRQQGHSVEFAAGGLAALALGQKHIFDLVFMDVRMPDLDGLETTRRWRDPQQNMLDPECPIIALTANALPAERERVIKAGMNDYVTKPVTMEHLAKAAEFAAQQQITRGIELTANTMLQTPLLNVTEESIRLRLLSTLSELHASLQSAYHINDRETFLDALHALKGCFICLKY